MKIGILGAGRIGGALGKLWGAGGHDIMFGVRNPQSSEVKTLLDSIGAKARAGAMAEVAAFGEVVLLAVPGGAAQEVIEQVDDWHGKILIDATNRMGPLLPGSSPSAAEDIAAWAIGAKVVKAFNSTGVGNLVNPHFGSQRADAYVCGDDEAAKAIVTELAQTIGFEVVDAGPLSNAGLLESLAKLWVQLAYSQGLGPDIAFKLLRRS